MDNDNPTQSSNEPHPASAEATQGTKRPYVWITAPLTIAFLGLLGTCIGAIFQQYSATQLERNKFEYQLIQKALAAQPDDALKALQFFNKIGLLKGLDGTKLSDATKEGASELPIFHGAALRDKIISVKQAKQVLKLISEENGLRDPGRTNFYNGSIDEKFDIDFQIAVMRFQKEMKLDIDGLIGPKTVLAMWDACAKCPETLRPREPPSEK